MTPDFKVIAAGINITPQIRERLLSLTVSDETGAKSDQVEITLDDRDNAIELPLPGAPLFVFMGYTVFFREMKQLRDAGYRLVGDNMLPPN